MGCCSDCAKNILFALNIIDFVMGAAIGVFGLVLMVKFHLAAEWQLWGPCFVISGLLIIMVILSECGKCCIKTTDRGQMGCTCFLTFSSYIGALVGALEAALALGTVFSKDYIRGRLAGALPTDLNGWGAYCCGAGCEVQETCGTIVKELQQNFEHMSIQMSFAAGLRATINVTNARGGYELRRPIYKFDNVHNKLSFNQTMLDTTFATPLGCKAMSGFEWHPEAVGGEKIKTITSAFTGCTHANTTAVAAMPLTLGEIDQSEADHGGLANTAVKLQGLYSDYSTVFVVVLFSLAALQAIRFCMVKFVRPDEQEDEMTRHLNDGLTDSLKYQNKVTDMRARQRFMREKETAMMEGRTVDSGNLQAEANIEEGGGCTVM